MNTVHARGRATRSTHAGANRPLATAAAVVVVATAVVVVASAPPAAANGTEPPATNFRSRVGDSPAGVQARVVGGDAYLTVAVEPGVELEVAGYDGEPYLRVDADGTVWRNTRSPATYLNEARYGEAGGARPPSEASADADPEWEPIAGGGRYAWHDHRIHWMSPDPPRQVEEATSPVEVFDWEVRVTVDGQPNPIRGKLTWFPADNPAGWLAAVALLAAGGVWATWRHGRWWMSVSAAGLAAVLAVVTLAGELSGYVPGRGLPGDWHVGLVALAGLIAIPVAVWRRKAMEAAALAAVLGGGVVALVRLPVLWQPVVTGPLGALPLRALVVATLAAAAVAILALVSAARPQQSATGSQAADDDPTDRR